MPSKSPTLSSQPISINLVHELVAASLKISVRTVLWIKYRKNANSILCSSGKIRPPKKFKATALPECIKKSIIRYTVYKEHSTLQSLYVELMEKVIILSNTSSIRVLHQIGFKFKKSGGRRALMNELNLRVDIRITWTLAQNDK